MSLYYEVDNFGTDKTELEPWQMLHIPSIITYDGIVGHGVIAHARETIGAGLAAEKSASHAFGGGKLPAVIVEHQGKLNDDVRNAFRKEWKELYMSPDGDEVALLGGGATAKPMPGISEKDRQFLETRQFDIEEIARWYGISPHLLQHLLRATFNNIEELGIDFVRYGIGLWLEIWEQTVAHKLFTPREQETMFAEHNVDALLRGNAAARAAFYQVMVNAALMNRNECRKLENLDPVEGGDVFLVQGATVPLGEDGKPESEFVKGAEPPAANPQPVDDDEDDTEDSRQMEEIKAAIESVASDNRALFTQLVSVRSNAERAMMRRLNWALTKEAVAIIDHAKTPAAFSARVEAFYTEHQRNLTEEFSELCAALSSCGKPITASEMVARWVADGKRAALVACERTDNPKDVQASVKRLTESPDWRNRPLRALMEGENATLVV
jgi:hypothetical protein